MKQNLQNKLYKFFPKIFVQKDLPKEQTCMCWGIECPDEWYDNIYHLCEVIQNYVDMNKKQQVEATQIKSKFGKLCFYTNYQDPYVQGAIAMTEQILNKLDHPIHISEKRKIRRKK